MGRTTREIAGLFAYSIGGILMYIAVIAGIATVPYLMARSGYAAWLYVQSSDHPVLVGIVLLLTGIALLKWKRRLRVGQPANVSGRAVKIGGA
ncbi:hypothetical protein [Paraburkholderia youngii]|uniref:hypothetical protein n=1 Tax=Paraburkholderia youngii TaxID=2782701 RepID=UPI003D1A1FFB